MVPSSSPISSQSTKKRKGRGPSGSESQFPGKLHDMMKFVEEHSLESIISWELNGFGFKINDPEKLVTILPLFFGQTQYRSFRRQLNMWNFHRITLECLHKETFIHPYFVKHDRELCAQMSRQIPFKPTQAKEREYIAFAALSSNTAKPNLASKAEDQSVSSPSEINNNRNTQCPHDSVEIVGNAASNDINIINDARSSQLSSGDCGGFLSPSAPIIFNNVGLSPLSLLPTSEQTKELYLSGLDEVLKTVEDVNNTVEGIIDVDSSALSVLSTALEQFDPDFEDELGCFEGMDFFFVENTTP